jgi:malonyl CoA-acyl carrier protein transacylase
MAAFYFLAGRPFFRKSFEMRMAVVFPGQGSQRAGMGQDFYESSALARAVFDNASRASGLDLKTLCFEENEDLNLTEFTQPCILTCEIAMLEAIKEQYRPDFSVFAGHSLGEYTALVAAGALSLEAAVQIVRRRGALMQEAVPEGMGAMSALKLSGIYENARVRAIIAEAGAEIANLNSSEQVVISGKAQSVQAAGEKLTAEIADIEVIPLTVSAPFHSQLMQTIEDSFFKTLQSFQDQFNAEKAAKVLSNFTGAFHEPARLFENLTRQISGSVRWIENMQALTKEAQAIYEIGPNRPLGSFFRTIGADVKSIINLKSAQKAFQ